MTKLLIIMAEWSNKLVPIDTREALRPQNKLVHIQKINTLQILSADNDKTLKKVRYRWEQWYMYNIKIWSKLNGI